MKRGVNPSCMSYMRVLRSAGYRTTAAAVVVGPFKNSNNSSVGACNPRALTFVNDL